MKLTLILLAFSSTAFGSIDYSQCYNGLQSPVREFLKLDENGEIKANGTLDQLQSSQAPRYGQLGPIELKGDTRSRDLRYIRRIEEARRRMVEDWKIKFDFDQSLNVLEITVRYKKAPPAGGSLINLDGYKDTNYRFQIINGKCELFAIDETEYTVGKPNDSLLNYFTPFAGREKTIYNRPYCQKFRNTLESVKRDVLCERTGTCPALELIPEEGPIFWKGLTDKNLKGEEASKAVEQAIESCLATEARIGIHSPNDYAHARATGGGR